MAPNNVNSLTYLCLDKVMEITQNTPPTPCQDSLQWISRAWSYIQRTPLLCQSYINLLYSNSTVSLQVSISTLSRHLPITYYEKNKLLYTCLDRKHYASLKKNVFLMNHLSNGVTHLHLKMCLHEPKHLATVPIKTFLKNCKSVNAVTFCDNLLSSDQYFRIRLKFKLGIDVTADELKLLHPVGRESLLLNCLTVCPNIKIIENLQITSVKIFCKYILGINFNRCIKNNEIHNIKNIVSWSKPSWPKLKSVDMPLNCYRDYIHVHNICFLILQDFQTGFLKDSNSSSMTQRFLQKLFESIEKKIAINLLRNKFKTISGKNYDFYYKEDLLANGDTTIDLDMTSPELGDCLKKLKGQLNVPYKRIDFTVSKLDGCGLPSNYEKLLDVTEYPFILKNISIIRIFCKETDILETITNIVTAATNLQILCLIFFKSFTIPNRSLILHCGTSIRMMCIKTYVPEFCHEYIESCMFMFPCVQHLSLIIENGLNNTSITNGNFDYVKQLNNLKSFHINLNNFTMDTENLLLFLDKISFKMNRNVKLYYSVNSRHLDTKILLTLRNRGWHFYRK